MHLTQFWVVLPVLVLSFLIRETGCYTYLAGKALSSINASAITRPQVGSGTWKRVLRRMEARLRRS